MTHIKKETTGNYKKSISEIYEKEKVYVYMCVSAMSHHVAQADSNLEILLLQSPECWMTGMHCHTQHGNGISSSTWASFRGSH